MRFRDHKYKWSKPWSAVYHQWSLRGPYGGLHLSINIVEGYEATAGLEFHHNYDPSGGQEAAHHKDCWLIGGPCWHDGTSLYASETVWPRVRDMMPDHEAIFAYLETLYDEHFNSEHQLAARKGGSDD